jgi:hypothetical protein
MKNEKWLSEEFISLVNELKNKGVPEEEAKKSVQKAMDNAVGVFTGEMSLAEAILRM